MPTIRRAECSCGRLSAECAGEPVRVSICHCLACQRRTGSAFGVQARFTRAQVTVGGESRTYTRTGDEGTKVDFHFCGDCGATVYYELEVLPGFVVVPVGAFADPSFPAPGVAVYEARRHGWAVSPALEVEHYD